MAERLIHYHPEIAVQTMDPISEKMHELEVNITSSRHVVDAEFKNRVNKRMNSSISLNGEENTIKEIIYGSAEKFDNTLDSVLKLRHEFYAYAIPDDPDNVALQKTEEEKVLVKANRAILDKAQSGAYNGSTEVLQTQAEFYLGSFFESINHTQETVSYIRKRRPELEGIIFTNEPTDKNP